MILSWNVILKIGEIYMSQDKVKFSGYKMAACAAVIFFSTIGIGYLTMGLYLPSLAQEMNANVGITSIMFGVLGATGMVAAFASGPMIAKIGVKKIILIGCISILSGYIFLYLAANIAMVFIAAGLAGIGFSWAGTICVGNVVPNWFIEKQGTILGWVIASSGIGGLVGSPMVSLIMSQYGWRNACLVTVIVMAIFIIPAALLIKGHPVDIGEEPLGYQAERSAKSQATNGVSFDAAKYSRTFWLLLVFLLCFNLLMNGVIPHIANFITMQGFGIVFAGTVMAVYSVVGMFGNIILGIINDKAGIKAALSFCGIAGILCLLFMLFCSTKIAAIGFGAFLGLTYPSATTLVPLLIVSVFGYKAFPQILGIYNGIIAFAGIIAPIAMGMVVTITGAYTYAIFALLVCVVVGYILGMTGITSNKRKKLNQMSAG
jgi:MFS family permease